MSGFHLNRHTWGEQGHLSRVPPAESILHLANPAWGGMLGLALNKGLLLPLPLPFPSSSSPSSSSFSSGPWKVRAASRAQQQVAALSQAWRQAGLRGHRRPVQWEHLRGEGASTCPELPVTSSSAPLFARDGS